MMSSLIIMRYGLEYPLLDIIGQILFMNLLQISRTNTKSHLYQSVGIMSLTMVIYIMALIISTKLKMEHLTSICQ